MHRSAAAGWFRCSPKSPEGRRWFNRRYQFRASLHPAPTRPGATLEAAQAHGWRSRNAGFRCSMLDVQQFAFRPVDCTFETRDVPLSAQTADEVGRKTMTVSTLAALALKMPAITESG